MIVKVQGRKCQYPDCEQPATTIAAGRGEGGLPVGVYCETHAYVAAEQGSPEYTDTCPNCGCVFGVN